jgi:hypothetical protein
MEYTGEEVLQNGIKTKEIKRNVIFIPILVKGIKVTNMYHPPCIEHFKKGESYDIPEEALKVVLV